MEILYLGKTKDVYKLSNGNVLLKFKDDVTGKDGKFDPGENTVGLTIEGMGRANLQTSSMFFEELKKRGIKTHYVSSNLQDGTMEVLACKPFGKGLEVICRLVATGSFIRRYGDYISNATPLKEWYVETTLKDDLRGDPLITSDGLATLEIMSKEMYENMKRQTILITKIIVDILKEKELDLWDVKFEFGYHNDEVILMDEISSGNMRVYQNGVIVDPVTLTSILNS